MKNRWHSLSLWVGLLVLLAGAFGAHTLFANQARAAVPAAVAQPITGHLLNMHTVTMANVPAEKPGAASQHPAALPSLHGVSQQTYLQRKAAAAQNANAPKTSSLYHQASSGPGIKTPAPTVKFPGMADSASICPYFGGCAPPDMALAVSPNWVVQGVNTSFAVYTPAGTLQAGWPKAAQSFFTIPDPGSCDPNGPFTFDPRAFYDPADGRFWVTISQVEGAPGLGIAPVCNFLSVYRVAVSQTNNPNGAWNIYEFDMANGSTNAAVYTQMAVDGQVVSFSGNLFDANGGAFVDAEAFQATKAAMEGGKAVTPHGFAGFTLNSIKLDTVQPVGVVTADAPRASLLLASENINFGGGNCVNGCNQLAVFAIAHPGTSSETITRQVITTPTYTLAPFADQRPCVECIDTGDTRISATPIYRNQLISFALDTGVNNGFQAVSAIFWGQMFVTLDDTGNLTRVSVLQLGTVVFGLDASAFDGALMPDNDGNLFMVFELSGESIAPESAYLSRRVTYNHGLFHDGGVTLGSTGTVYSSCPQPSPCPWGQYEAASYDGPGTDNIWLAGQHSGTNGDWATEIGETRMTLAFP